MAKAGGSGPVAPVRERVSTHLRDVVRTPETVLAREVATTVDADAHHAGIALRQLANSSPVDLDVRRAGEDDGAVVWRVARRWIVGDGDTYHHDPECDRAASNPDATEPTLLTSERARRSITWCGVCVDRSPNLRGDVFVISGGVE